MLDNFVFPILAHGDAEQMSMSDMLWSVGLLVLSSALATAFFLAIFLKRILRARRLWKEGKVSPSSKTIYMAVSGALVLVFVWIVYQFAMAVYYDYHYGKYEEAEQASGRHLKGGVEYKWKRWHINGRYVSGELIWVVEDILKKADPKDRITASARKTSPTPGDWRSMKWDDEKKAFVAVFEPEDQKMDFEFELSSGLSRYQDTLIGYIPRSPPADAVMTPEQGAEDERRH